jgi:hypothetical protein
MYAVRAVVVGLILCGCTGERVSVASAESTGTTSDDQGDEVSETGGTGAADADDGDDDTPGESSCKCTPLPPEGWDGPFTTRGSFSPVPECPSEYPDLELVLHQDLEVEASECTCACGTIEGECPGGTLEQHVDATCSRVAGDSPSTPIEAGTCLGPDPGQSGFVGVVLADAVEATCPATVESAHHPDGHWGRHVAVCGGAKVESCGPGSLCVPAYESACIIAEGRHQSCPNNAYYVRFLAYRTMKDDRDCECACEPDAACSGVLHIHDDADCDGAAISGNCLEVAGGTGVSLQTSIEGSCSPEAAVVGELVPDDVMTICCGGG